MRALVLTIVLMLICAPACLAGEALVTQIVLNDDIRIFRISKELLPELDDVEKPLELLIDDNERIHNKLASELSAEQYRAFCESYEREGYAEITVYYASVASVLNSELGSWLVVRQMERAIVAVHVCFVSRPDMYDELTVHKRSFRLENGVLRYALLALESFELESMEMIELSSSDAIFIGENDGYRIAVYEVMDMRIGVFEGTQLNYLDGFMMLYIDGKEVHALNGEQIDDRVIFVVPLENEEADAVMRGRSVSLERIG